ncbi:MAG: class III extradiol ring-cleavage dioxygenase family protein [Cellulomonas sp.]
MLIAAALVPGTVLLVPGAGGRDDEATDVIRHAATAAVGAMFRQGVDRVLVIAPARVDRHLVTGWQAGLGDVGIGDGQVRWPLPARPEAGHDPGRSAHVDVEVRAVAGQRGLDSHSSGARPAPQIVSALGSAALALVAHTMPDGWAGDLEVLEVREPGRGARTSALRAEELRERGRALLRSGPHDALGLVVAGSLSARNGEDAPLAADDRAPGLDGAVAADLLDGGAEARRRLGELDPDLAADLGMSGWAPWQVLVGACGALGAVEVDRVHVDRCHGVVHVSASWRCTEVGA